MHGVKIAVKKTMVVCTAHRLMNHPGACKNLHGHNYAITVHLGRRDFESEKGMVVDFGDVKQVIGTLINDLFDHKTVLQATDPLAHALMGLPETYNALTIMNDPPTAENMAEYLMLNITHAIEVAQWAGVYVFKVEVEETPNNTAYAWSK